jgi:Coenzyme PQQ synthesis protein D (PqqD)
MTAPVARQMKRNPVIEEAPLQDELMLFDPGQSKFFVLNQTMAFVWRSCDGGTSLSDIATRLTEEFSGVDMENALRDVHSAAAELATLGLLLD